MKVFILTEAGRKVGFGHLTRCIALSQAFRKKGIVPLLVVNGDKSILDLLRDENYLMLNWLKNKNKLLKIIKGSSTIIIDSYLASKNFYDEISRQISGKIGMIDDFNRIEYPKGILINPSVYGGELNYPTQRGMLYLLGKDYIILRKEFWNAPEKRINKKIKNILVTFGGMNRTALIDRITGFLEEKFDFHLYAIDVAKNKLAAGEILELMLNSDMAISGGGQTAYELARIGVPTLGVCLADNQLLNLTYGDRAGYLKFIGWHNDGGLINKIEETAKDLSYSKRIKMNTMAKKSVDGKGAERIVEKMME
ncbi:MAG: UDP-2,4-diacetamido-2,4,6-trideoxy-beta-L-altropyranose hydrolase [Candidatus Omnitrophota bacterium]|jgi:spore coat polysaccharide biosynthesis predicted glycosyltransferase SpsG